jgi:16S rRNA (uracil1498-N3)-methyltransferase
MDDDQRTPSLTRGLPRFLLRVPVAAGDRVALEADEARHVRVRRLRRGETVALFDGQGRCYVATVDRITAKQVEVVITAELPQRTGESSLVLTLALALLKADRFDLAIEKCTELGVARIRPFISEHSLARPSASRRARWSAIALSAAKQCGRSVVPAVDAPVKFSAILDDADPCRVLYYEDTVAETPPTTTAEHPFRATVIIGAEGGFSAAEVDQARAARCTILSLGPRILRAETAAIAAVTRCQAWWGDLAAAGPSS